MAAKNFQNIDVLKELAAPLPTQRPPAPAYKPMNRETYEPAKEAAKAAPIVAREPQIQISFSARPATRKRMFQVAHDNDVTLKTLILGALREKYPALGITDDDLVDLRSSKR